MILGLTRPGIQEHARGSEARASLAIGFYCVDEQPMRGCSRRARCRGRHNGHGPAASVAAQGRTSQTSPPPFSVVEATIPDMRDAMAQGRVTSRQIVQQYLDRIARYEDQLNAVITVNPRALADADALDRERRRGRIRGPLHGIPIALKDNIHTTDMPTTGGALAFARSGPAVRRHAHDGTCEQAGAIIIAKTGLTELANWVAVGMPGNYNSLAGYGFNPYDPRPRPARAALSTGGPCSAPAARARASARPPASGRRTSAPRRRGRS